ncbi:transposable element Tcb2 transposase [Trichonephila clavipes]|nr:transposable element Tcb2 transposase [Trichonephila clavipes]
MGLSQADAARRLNVSRSVVQRLWDQYQSEDSVSRRPVPGRPRATTLSEDRFLALSARRRRTTTVPQLVADHFQASGRRISATTVRNRLHNADLYARRPVVCVPLNGRQRRNRLCWAREHVSWTQQQWASVLFTDESRFTMESDSGRLLIWREQRTRYHQSNTVERHSYRGGGILVWAGISLGGHTDLHVFHGGTVTGLRYRDEILDPYVRPYAAAIGNDFILMDDNARPHRARIVEEYLEDHGLERMEWPARSPDLNPIEPLWDYLGREVAALNPPPRSLHELKQGLLCVWSSLPIPVSDNLINSMGNRCRQCIQSSESEDTTLSLSQSFEVSYISTYDDLDSEYLNDKECIIYHKLVAFHFKYDQARRRFVEWAQNKIAVVPDFHKRILFSDEAHFWLNGYVNKQNCRIWSEANPQVYVETPLHPEKLTVWCALWAGGIIGPYFFKNDEDHNVTVNGDRYRATMTNFFIPELNNHDVQELWFQQDGATCHTTRATIDLLKDTLGDRLISRFGPVNWPPRSCEI